MDVLTVLILIGIGFFVIVTITICSLKRFEVALFLVVFSPWISTLLVPKIPGEVEEPAVGSYLRIGLLMWMGAIGLIEFFRIRALTREKLPFHMILLGFLLLFALISTTYSIDPRYTFIRSCSFIALFGFLLGFHYWLQDLYRFEMVLRTLFLLVCFFIFINILSPVLLPDRIWGFEEGYRFQGLWGHPNMMGGFCMISYPILLWAYPRSSFFWKFVILLLLIPLIYMHFLTGSRSSFMGSFLGICAWFFIKRKKTALILFGITIVILVLLVMQFKPASFQREEGSEVTDLTGREEFWKGSYSLLMKKPILGYGFGVEGKIWEDPRYYKKEETLWSGSVRTSLHNGYLSVAIGLGLVGFLVWCILLLIPFFRAIALPFNDLKAFAFSIMLMGFLINFVETLIMSSSEMLAIFFWLAWVSAGRLSYRYLQEREPVLESVSLPLDYRMKGALGT